MESRPLKVTHADGWVKEYLTSKEARKDLHTSCISLKKCLADKSMSWKGYQFEYMPKVERAKCEPPARKIPEKTQEEREALMSLIFGKNGVRAYHKTRKAKEAVLACK